MKGSFTELAYADLHRAGVPASNVCPPRRFDIPPHQTADRSAAVVDVDRIATRPFIAIGSRTPRTQAPCPKPAFGCLTPRWYVKDNNAVVGKKSIRGGRRPAIGPRRRRGSSRARGGRRAMRARRRGSVEGLIMRVGATRVRPPDRASSSPPWISAAQRARRSAGAGALRSRRTAGARAAAADVGIASPGRPRSFPRPFRRHRRRLASPTRPESIFEVYRTPAGPHSPRIGRCARQSYACSRPRGCAIGSGARRLGKAPADRRWP